MRNSWLDKYLGSYPKGDEHRNPKTWANLAIGFLAIATLGVLIAGSMWVQMKDSQGALAQISSSHARGLQHSLKEKATSLLALAENPKAAIMDEMISGQEENFSLQGISDLDAASEGSKLDPFSPLVTSGADPGFDPTRPKDILDNIQFTGFINDTKAKDKVAIIRVGAPGNTTSLIRKVGEAFYAEDQKIVIKDIKSNTLYLSVNGAQRTLELSPYDDSALASSGGSASTAGSSPGGGVSAPAAPGSAGENSGESLNLEEI